VSRSGCDPARSGRTKELIEKDEGKPNTTGGTRAESRGP
jgi:hypothetical protein